MAREQYMRQVDLLVRTLPFIARRDAFALKGGTAINLFYRDMPRLSVDIELTYLPIEDRGTTLKNIDTTLEHIREYLMRNLSGVNVGGSQEAATTTPDSSSGRETPKSRSRLPRSPGARCIHRNGAG